MRTIKDNLHVLLTVGAIAFFLVSYISVYGLN